MASILNLSTLEGLVHLIKKPLKMSLSQILNLAEIAISDATLILFVVDIEIGITPLDEEVSRILHKSGRKVILVGNKSITAKG